jgi:hypothetical protein
MLRSTKCHQYHKRALPRGRPSRDHPTNEDLFVGTPGRRSLRDLCWGFAVGAPPEVTAPRAAGPAGRP